MIVEIPGSSSGGFGNGNTLFLRFFITTVMPRLQSNSKSLYCWESLLLDGPRLSGSSPFITRKSIASVWAPNESGSLQLTPQRRRTPIKTALLGNQATDLHVSSGDPKIAATR